MSEVRGLTKSRLARALWIEIMSVPLMMRSTSGRGSREPCGLKSIRLHCSFPEVRRRGSREPCGLKLELGGLSNQNGVSRLARALWIEILICRV